MRFPRFLRPLALGLAALFLLSVPAMADYTATGRFQYEDRQFDINGFIPEAIVPRPIRLAQVRIMAGSTELARGATREDGSFSIDVPGSAAQQITAICVSSSANGTSVPLDVRVAGDSYEFGDYYSVASALSSASGSGNIDLGTTTAISSSEVGKAFNIYDVCLDSMQFVASPQAAGAYPAPRLTALWRANHPRSGAFYTFSSQGRYLFMSAVSAYDDTIIAHEFGHYIDSLYSKSDSPGGSHFIGDGNQDMRLSWGEGLATLLGSASRRFKGYSHPEIYVNTDGVSLGFSYELESLTGSVTAGSKTGSSNEIAVSAALWDIIDSPSDYATAQDDDPMRRPFSDIWKVLTQYMPTVTRPGITIETFWDGWFAPSINNGALTDMQAVFNNLNGIEFVADSSEPDNTPAGAPALRKAQRPALVSGSKILINELEMGAVDALELYNAGDTAADLTGWAVEASAPGSSTARYNLPSFRLAAGAFVTLTEATGLNTSTILYFGSNISWANDRPGACILRNRAGDAVDFVRWGSSTEPVPAGTSFGGPNPAPPPIGRTLGRNYSSADTNGGSDWTAQVSTFGTHNWSEEERHHTFYPSGDLDYGSFEALGGMTYLVETMNLGNGADTIAELLGIDGATVLASSDDYDGSKASSRLAWTAPASGRYFVRIRRFAGAANIAQYGSYDLRLVESSLAYPIPMPRLLTVSRPGQGGTFQSLVDAVVVANSGDTVEILDSGIYPGSLVISGKDITLRASPGKNPVIDGRDSGALATVWVTNVKSFTMDGVHLLGSARGLRIDSGSAVVTNSVITGAANPIGYGVSVVGSRSAATLVNCTIFGNAALGIGVFTSASAKIVNSIVYGNAGDDISGDGTASSLIVRNSLVQNPSYIGANGNIGADPRFVDASGGDFRLKSDSPAIDAGTDSDPDLPPTDSDGLPRSLDGKGSGKAIPDMGAFEYLPPALLSATAIFPQIATGGTNPPYRTSIVGINTGGTSAMVSLSLAKSTGEPFPITVLNARDPSLQSTLLPAQAASIYGKPTSSFSMVIPPAGAVRLEAGGGGSLTAGYALFRSSGPINGSALFKTLSGEKILSEAGASLSKPTKSFLVYIDNLIGAMSGYAIANYGTSVANVVLTLRDAGGSQVAVKTITLAAGAHIAEFAVERFKDIPGAGAGFEGSIEAASDQNVAAVALRYDNPGYDTFSTIPVMVDEAAQTLYFPQVADGGTYRTNFILMNRSGTPATANLEFFDKNGSPLGLSFGGVLKTSHSMPIAARGVARLITDGTGTEAQVGWVRVTCPVAIGGSAIFQTVRSGRILSEAGVSASPPASRLTTYVETLGSAEAGLAICNPNAGPVSLTLRLRNPAGEIVATTSTTLPGFGHVARFFTESDWFPNGYSEFQGTLEVIASQPVSAVALRYDNTEQNVFATLPVIPF